VRLSRDLHDLTMTTQEQVPLSYAVKHLGVTHQAFHRWRKAAGIKKKGYYRASELALLEQVGNYLREDRSLTRAKKYVNELLGI